MRDPRVISVQDMNHFRLKTFSFLKNADIKIIFFKSTGNYEDETFVLKRSINPVIVSENQVYRQVFRGLFLYKFVYTKKKLLFYAPF